MLHAGKEFSGKSETQAHFLKFVPGLGCAVGNNKESGT